MYKATDPLQVRAFTTSREGHRGHARMPSVIERHAGRRPHRDSTLHRVSNIERDSFPTIDTHTTP